MGLFKKGKPVEKKLKDLTGGLVLNKSFIKRLKQNNLSVNDGIKIQRQLKDEMKKGKLNEENVEIRLNQLISEYKGDSAGSLPMKECPSCGKVLDADYTFCIDCGHRLVDSLKVECPSCGKIQDGDNSFCIGCGHDLVGGKADDTKITCPNCSNVQSFKSSTCSDCGFDFETKSLPKLLKKCPICQLMQRSANMRCINCRHDLRDVDYEECDELIECSNCGRRIPKNKDMCPFCRHDFKAVQLNEIKEKRKEEKLDRLPSLDEKRRITFLYNHDFNIKECPDCNARLLKSNPFCFNCGASVLTKETIKNDNLEVRDGKLVEKVETEHDQEMSDLEALYTQTVKSKYSHSFKVAYVLYLEEFRKNPTKKFSESIAKRYETTPNKLKRQALEDEFIELASPLVEAKGMKVSDLKEILKEHGLKVSGRKDELIERLGENLSEDELKKHFKSKNYQISSKGEEFLANNSYIIYISKNNDIMRVFHPSDLGKIFEEKEYSQDEIYDKLLIYFKGMLDEKLTNETWIDFKPYSNAVAQIQEDKGDLKDALNTRFKIFLFDINNFSINMSKPNPSETRLRQSDMTKLVDLMHRLTLPIDELKEMFEAAFDEVLFETAITGQDSLVYLLKVFGGEDLDDISREINQRYSNPR